MVRLRALASFVVSLCLLLSPTISLGGVAYSAFSQGRWRIYYQADLTSMPQLVASTIMADSTTPALAPKAAEVAFEVQSQGLYICPLQAEASCHHLVPPQGMAVRPVWHYPTGELIFVNYVVSKGHEDSDILITRGALQVTGPLLTQTGNQDDPDVSPDGRLLAYTSAQTISLYRSAVQVVQHLWIMHLETGVARQLVAGSRQDIHPDWSPSGDAIAFASNRTGQFEIWSVNSDGRHLQQLTSGPGAKTWPAWSPDGTAIMFTWTRNGRQQLGLVNVDGTHVRPFEPFGPNAAIELRDADWR